MHLREQYLEKVRAEHQEAHKAGKGRLLDEAQKRTGLNRKYLIRKLGGPYQPPLKKKRQSKRKARFMRAITANLINPYGPPSPIHLRPQRCGHSPTKSWFTCAKAGSGALCSGT